LLKITEINPFIPHYYCNNCKCLTPASKFNLFPENGLDLPPKRCRHCQKELISDGHNIEVEIFAGYEKARALDIDINVDADFHRQSQKLLATT